MMPSNVKMKNVRREMNLSEHIPTTHLNSPSIFETRDGMLGMVIQLEGVVFEMQSETEINQYRKVWHDALLRLDERFCVYSTVRRYKRELCLKDTFQNEYAELLNNAYSTSINEKSMYCNAIYLTVIHRGVVPGKLGKGLQLINHLLHKAVKDARECARQEQMKILRSAVSQMMVSLKNFKPRLLGVHDQLAGRSELLHFLGFIVNGGVSLSYRYPIHAPAISRSLSLRTRQMYPFGNLSHYLANQRLFFGKYIQFQGAAEDDTRYGAIITVKQYGACSSPVMLDKLIHLEAEFVHTNSFAIESPQHTLGRVNQHITKMNNVNDPALSQIDALSCARELLASGEVIMGHHHNTLLLIARTTKELDRAIERSIKTYADAGFVAIRETLGEEPAYWAQIPGNLNYIARSSLITSENFVDFSPLHNYRMGYCDQNHLTRSVSVLETPSKTPYYFNYHVKGSKTNPSKGHAIIIGGNGAGKTAFMCFMDAQLSRYHGRSFFFDRDRSAELYLSASGGCYSILSPDFPDSTCFNPLQLNDTPSNRKFNRELLAQCCKNSEEETLSAEEKECISQCIDYAYDCLSPKYRTLSHATKVLPYNFTKWPNLRLWLNASDTHAQGEYAYIFDNPTDTLSLSEKAGFDLTHFLDQEPTHVRTALMMYLCHRVELTLNGDLVSLYFDEGWQNLIDPYWKSKFKRWLPTLRKKNAHIVIATQSPSSVISSPLRGVIMDNVATQIYFPNPQAKREEYVGGFNLTEEEYKAVLKNTPESRQFLVKQDNDSAQCRLDLTGLKDHLSVLSGNVSTIRLMEELKAQYGTLTKEWLPIFLEHKKEGVV